MYAALIAVAHSSPPSSLSVYNWVWIPVGVLALIGAAFSVVRWLENRGVAKAALKALVDANVLKRLSEQDRVLADIQRVTRPNGLDTDDIGDVVKRTENKLNQVEMKIDVQAEKLDRHLEASHIVWREVERTLDRKQDRVVVP